MKRVSALLLALALMLACTACSLSTEDKNAQEADAEKPGVRKIGIIIYNFDDSFMTLYKNELVSYFDSLGTDELRYEVSVADGKSDQMVQNKAVEGFIAQGVDAIILNAVKPSSLDSVIDRVVSVGIPLVLINREPLGTEGDESYPGIVNNPLVCYVGADSRQSGRYQGEIIRDLPDHGDINGDGMVSYIMLEGDPENPDARHRTEYSIKALTDAGIAVRLIDDRVGDWMEEKGQLYTAIDLAKFGDEIEVVFCNNDAMALGAYTAITGAGRTVGKNIYLVGVDALDECVMMVRDGRMTGTVRNDYVNQSHTAADVAAAALNGETIANYYWVDYVKITNDLGKQQGLE